MSSQSITRVWVMQHNLYCQPHCSWESDTVPPTQLQIHWGGMAGLQPLHHPQHVPAQGPLPRFKEPGQEEPPASHSHSPFFPVELALCWTKGCKGSMKGDYVAAKRRIRQVG